MKRLTVLTVLLFFVQGCASVPLQIDHQKPCNTEYEILGEGVATATGIMLFQVIPIGQNSRFQRAYQSAVASKGGDALINVEVTERWFWAYVLNGYKTTVKGTVIKYKK